MSDQLTLCLLRKHASTSADMAMSVASRSRVCLPQTRTHSVKLWIVPLPRQADEDGDPIVVGLIVAQASDGIAEHRKKVYRSVGTFQIEDNTGEDLGWDITDLRMVDIELV